MPQVQYLTLVTTGGTPVRIADQRGSPYPTTGYGSLVFSNGATFDNATFNNTDFTDVVFTGTSTWEGEIIATPYGGTGVNGFGNVTAFTSDHTLTSAQSYQTFSNVGATGTVRLTLPTPVTGLEYTFVAAEAQSLVLDVGGSVVIALGEITTTPGGELSSNSPYSVLTLKALSPTLWVATSLLGTWTPI